MAKKRFKQAEMAAWIGIVGNILLAVMKAVVGWLSGSKALIADAAHSASDVAGSFAVLVGLKAAKKPPDKDHPYGHGKAEPIAAIIVSILLILVGIEIGISAVQSIFEGVSEPPKWYAIIAIVLAIAAKEAMFQYKYRLGRRLSSQALVANAWEHRSDVYSSIAALVGIGGAMLGGVTDVPLLYYLDPLAGLIVSLFVIYMGYRLVTESIHNTMDHVLHDEDTQGLRDTIEQVPGVIVIDDLRGREHGHYVIVDVKIAVNPNISVADGHDIGKEVKLRLIREHERVSDVFVHINPYDSDFPYNEDGNNDNDNRPMFLH